ncbi:MAG: hypothetical protein KDA21_06205 [Phycisphaerales bacterium]|nr:hypothetical protein [Phycisphaerales bacterium]
MTREDVRRANRAAAAMTPDDARLIMAARVAESLQGGKAALLRPERRLNLLRMATRLGIRPFDANLIIAIVQDSARRGESLDDVQAQGRLSPIPHPALAARRRHSRRFWTRVRTVVAAVCIAAMALVWLINWIAG